MRRTLFMQNACSEVGSAVHGAVPRCLVLLALALLHSADASGDQPFAESVQPETHGAVLLLHSFQPDTAYTILQREALVETIGRHPAVSSIRNEYLDLGTQGMENAHAEVRDVLKSKFQARRFRLIICTDSVAFKFLLNYGDELFPGIPIVFSALNSPILAEQARGREITGVMERIEILATLRLMLELNPGVKKIIFINDSSDHGKRLKDMATEASREFAGRVQFELWMDQDAETATKRISGLDASHAVLFLANSELWPDHIRAADCGLAKVCRASPVPVYAVFDAFLGTGIVGGVFASGDAQGRTAGGLALRILNGERASSIPIVTESPNRIIFDDYALKKWGISRSSLPPGSVVRADPPTFSQKYALYILAGVGCLVLEFIVITLLVVQRRMLRKSETALRSNEERLRILIEHSPAAIAMFDRDMKYVGHSRRWLTDYGLKDESVIGRTHYDVFPDIPDRWKEIHQRCLKGTSESCNEDCFLRDDGSTVWISWSIQPWSDAKGHIGGIIMFTEVITERRRLASELNHFFNLSMDVLCVVDSKGYFRRVNPACSAILGYSNEELMQKPFIEFVHTDDHERTAAEFARMLEGFPVIDFENRYVTKDGSIRWLQWRATRIESDGLCHAVARDVTDRRASEQSLRESERRLALVLDATSEGVWDWNIQTGEDFFSDQWVKSLGYTREDVIPHVSFWASIVHPDDMPNVVAVVQEHLNGDSPHYMCENRLRMKNGEYRWNLACGRIVDWDEDGKPLRMLGTDCDISDRKAAELALQEANELLQQRVMEKTAALRESEERLYQLANAAFEGIAIHENGRILAANRSFGDLFGYTQAELIGMTRPELMLDKASPATSADGSDPGDLAEEMLCESVGTRRDGTTFPCELRAKWMPYQGRNVRVTAVRDITERKHAAEIEASHQNELAHAMRRVTLGELASGLAHELNQPLAAIVNYTNACLRNIEKTSDGRGEIADVMRHVATQAQRAGDIIRRMRTFISKGEPQRTDVDVNDVVRDALRFVETDIKACGITTQVRLAENLDHVSADSIQLEQVVLNLLRNATDAMCNTPSENRLLTVVTCPSGPGRIEVSIADTGPGIAPEFRAKLFQPFSTTKSKGMGLGLSISRGIIEAHGGQLSFDSIPTGGTIFRFQLSSRDAGKGSAGSRNRTKGDGDKDALHNSESDTLARTTI